MVLPSSSTWMCPVPSLEGRTREIWLKREWRRNTEDKTFYRFSSICLLTRIKLKVAFYWVHTLLGLWHVGNSICGWILSERNLNSIVQSCYGPNFWLEFYFTLLKKVEKIVFHFLERNVISWDDSCLSQVPGIWFRVEIPSVYMFSLWVVFRLSCSIPLSRFLL